MIEIVFINYLRNIHKVIRIELKNCEIFKIVEFRGI